MEKGGLFAGEVTVLRLDVWDEGGGGEGRLFFDSLFSKLMKSMYLILKNMKLKKFLIQKN